MKYAQLEPPAKPHSKPHTKPDSIIVKYIQLPNEFNHPRGWNSAISHQRKLKSYEVESNWYQSFNQQNDCFKMPKCLGVFKDNNERVIVLEDLDASGYEARLTSVNDSQIKQVIKWLAYFHVAHLQLKVDSCFEDLWGDLWGIGTYWNLDTRPEELDALTDIPLKQNAKRIDQLLNDCPVQTLVHGDAKLANFCFDLKNEQVAGVDFQYIGKGVGVKDLAYFLGGCFEPSFYAEGFLNADGSCSLCADGSCSLCADGSCSLHAEGSLYAEGSKCAGTKCEIVVNQYVDYYFEQLNTALKESAKTSDKKSGKEFDQLEELWRDLFDIAWVDFQRFVKGWSPDHWKINNFSEQLKNNVLEKMKKDSK
ncbi:MAG: phosphotransferase [Saccharospirillaceae bacterium]|nr:phosphotransferase [Pseudomonadales bacterium]NRB78837.1 phosphotransferase [Saccharospirillaceae bacterium]